MGGSGVGLAAPTEVIEFQTIDYPSDSCEEEWA
jgi:hypothetical protein